MNKEIILMSILLIGIVFVSLCTQNAQTPITGGGTPTAPPTPSPQLCSDQTPYGQCSSNQPQYCDNGNLINACGSPYNCGCPTGQTCQPDNTCQTTATIQGNTSYSSLNAIVSDANSNETDDSAPISQGQTIASP